MLRGKKDLPDMVYVNDYLISLLCLTNFYEVYIAKEKNFESGIIKDVSEKSRIFI